MTQEPTAPKVAVPTQTSPPQQPAREPQAAPAPASTERETEEVRAVALQDQKPKEAALQVKQAPISVGDRGLRLTSLEEWVRLAKYAIAAGHAPNMNIEQAIAAIQFGSEVGLTPFQALNSIAVINGKPALYGDGAKAVVEASGQLEDSDDWFEHDGKRLAPGVFPVNPNDTTTAFCSITRRGRTPKVRSFSVADAKRANLWGKMGSNGKPTPWVTYPQRMLLARAEGFARRDTFADALKGFFTEYEARDIIEVEQVPEPKRLSETKGEAAAS